ncbi:MAG: hypothetical protein N2235_18620 [Fischerella sp.]|nr:hypothetical protein [Fischerella sp.]
MRNRKLQKQYQISRSVPAMNQDLYEGMGLYQKFNHFSPSCVVRVPHSRLIPPIVVELGELVGLIYRSDKGQPGQAQAYIHFMQDPPRLVSNIAGTQLYIVGGSYRITKHGIEG